MCWTILEIGKNPTLTLVGCAIILAIGKAVSGGQKSGAVDSFVRPAPRAFFRPDRR